MKNTLRAAVVFLQSQANVRNTRCLHWVVHGSGYSLDVALQEPTLRTAIINYGHLATDTDSLKTPPMPGAAPLTFWRTG